MEAFAGFNEFVAARSVALSRLAYTNGAWPPGPAAIVDAATGAVSADFPVPVAVATEVWVAAGFFDGRLLVAHGRTERPQVLLLDPKGNSQPVSRIEGGYGVPVLPGNV